MPTYGAYSGKDKNLPSEGRMKTSAQILADGIIAFSQGSALGSGDYDNVGMYVSQLMTYIGGNQQMVNALREVFGSGDGVTPVANGIPYTDAAGLLATIFGAVMNVNGKPPVIGYTYKATITAPGSGYAVGNALAFSGLAAPVTGIDAGGGVTSIGVITPASGVTKITEDGAAPTGGSGTGLELSIRSDNNRVDLYFADILSGIGGDTLADIIANKANRFNAVTGYSYAVTPDAGSTDQDYVVNDPVTVAGLSLTVASVDVNGKITGYNNPANGAVPVNVTGAAVSGGSGTGATADVVSTAINALVDLQDAWDRITAETARAKSVEGDLSELTTDAKNELTDAINEVDAHTDANTLALQNKADKVSLLLRDFTPSQLLANVLSDEVFTLVNQTLIIPADDTAISIAMTGVPDGVYTIKTTDGSRSFIFTVASDVLTEVKLVSIDPEYPADTVLYADGTGWSIPSTGLALDFYPEGGYNISKGSFSTNFPVIITPFDVLHFMRPAQVLNLDGIRRSAIRETEIVAGVVAKLDKDTNTRITNLESLGHYLTSFATKADIETSVAWFEALTPPLTPTVNDYVFVVADESESGAYVRYRINSISGDTITYGAGEIIPGGDPSGKMDIVTGAAEDNIATFDDEGQVKDSGSKLSDLAAETQTVTADTETTAKLTTVTGTIAAIFKAVFNAINGIISFITRAAGFATSSQGTKADNALPKAAVRVDTGSVNDINPVYRQISIYSIGSAVTDMPINGAAWHLEMYRDSSGYGYDIATPVNNSTKHYRRTIWAGTIGAWVEMPGKMPAITFAETDYSAEIIAKLTAIGLGASGDEIVFNTTPPASWGIPQNGYHCIVFRGGGGGMLFFNITNLLTGVSYTCVNYNSTTAAPVWERIIPTISWETLPASIDDVDDDEASIVVEICRAVSLLHVKINANTPAISGIYGGAKRVATVDLSSVTTPSQGWVGIGTPILGSGQSMVLQIIKGNPSSNTAINFNVVTPQPAQMYGADCIFRL